LQGDAIKKVILSQQEQAKKAGKAAVKSQAMKFVPKIKFKTQYSKLLVGECPIVDMDIDFGFGGDGGDDGDGDGGGDGEQKGDDAGGLGFQLDKGALVAALPANFINIFKKLAINFVKLVKSGTAFVLRTINLVRKCCPPHFPIIFDVKKDICGMVMALDFSLMQLPVKLVKALKRIVVFPRDVYRLCGSTKVLMRLLATAIKSKSSDPLPALTKITAPDEEGAVDDELNGDNEMKDEELPGGLNEAQKEADDAATDVQAAANAEPSAADVEDEEEEGADSQEEKEEGEDTDGEEGEEEEDDDDDESAAETEDDDDDDDDVLVLSDDGEQEDPVTSRLRQASVSNSVRASFSGAVE
jgi:hypothetical protein